MIWMAENISLQWLSADPIHLNPVKLPLITLSVLFLTWLFVDRKAGERVSSWKAWWETASPRMHDHVILALIAVWTLFLCYLKIQQHRLFQTGFDLAIYGSVAWHMVHGPIFYGAIYDNNTLSGHFSPIYFLIGGWYWLWEDPIALLILQSLGLGAGGVALYRLALRQLGHGVWTGAILVLYGVHSYLHTAHSKDFHTSLLAIPVILWLFYFADSERKGMTALFVAIGLTIEESILPGLAGIGLYLAVFRPRMRKVGILCVVTAGITFLLATLVIMPAFHEPGGLSQWDRYAHLGSSFREAVINMLSNPLWAVQQAVLADHKYYYVLALFGSLGFVPFLAWRQALMVLPPLVVMVLSQNPNQYQLGFHYSAPVLPFLYYAFVCGVVSLRINFKKIIPSPDLRERVVAGFFVFLFGLNVVQASGYDLKNMDQAYAEVARTVLADIPEGASVAGTGSLVPQLINRHRVCFVRWQPGKLCEWGAPEFVILDMSERRRIRPSQEAKERFVRSLMEDLGYTIVEEREGFIVFHGQERLGPEYRPTLSGRSF